MSGEILPDQGSIECAESLRAAPLRIGVSTRALFCLEEEHRIFETEGVRTYTALQRSRENIVLDKGAAFDVVDRLLKLNVVGSAPFVDVILISRNSPDLSLRAFNSVEKHGIPIKTGSFTSGRKLASYISAWGIDLFLSNEDRDVQAAAAAGTAAARLRQARTSYNEEYPDEVRIAFDGDAVVFSAESDEIYAKEGLPAFLAHEQENAKIPMRQGPLGKFLKKLSLLRRVFLNSETNTSKVRIAIVTARNAPAHARVIHTLRAWGTPADEAHFVGTFSKAPILAAFAAHIFFDDQEKHVLSASDFVSAGLVPGPHKPDKPIIPA